MTMPINLEAALSGELQEDRVLGDGSQYLFFSDPSSVRVYREGEATVQTDASVLVLNRYVG